MSGLAGILAHHHDPGVYRWHAAFPAHEVEHAVEHAGWRFGYVDGWHHQSRGEFLAALGETLSFPEHYGQNLDALNDCLRDLPGQTVLLWDGWGTLARSDPQAFSVALSVLGGRVNADRGTPFAVLLRGDGPDPGLPSLD